MRFVSVRMAYRYIFYRNWILFCECDYTIYTYLPTTRMYLFEGRVICDVSYTIYIHSLTAWENCCDDFEARWYGVGKYVGTAGEIGWHSVIKYIIFFYDVNELMRAYNAIFDLYAKRVHAYCSLTRNKNMVQITFAIYVFGAKQIFIR